MLLNKQRASEYMQRYELDALIATSPINIRYFTDYHCWLDPIMKEYMMVPGASSNLSQQYAVFPSGGEPALVVAPIFAVNATDLWIKDLYTFGDAGLDGSVAPAVSNDTVRRFIGMSHDGYRNASATEALLEVLKDRGLNKARIGLELEGLPEQVEDAIVQSLPRVQIRDCSNLIRLIRMVKSQEEIARLRKAAEIGEIAGMESLNMARAGCPMAELAQHYRARIGEMGADFDHFAFGIQGLGIATEPYYVLSDDDVLYTDYGCIYRGYFSDTGTTLAMHKLPSPLRDRFDALRACMDAGEDAIRPGVEASKVRGAMWRVLNEHDYTACFPHGHGVGLEVRDYPIIVENNGLHIRDDCVDISSDLPLEKDMVINLEAGMFLPGVGSLQIEQTFIVTAAGSRPLVLQHRTQPLYPSS